MLRFSAADGQATTGMNYGCNNGGSCDPMFAVPDPHTNIVYISG